MRILQKYPTIKIAAKKNGVYEQGIIKEVDLPEPTKYKRKILTKIN